MKATKEMYDAAATVLARASEDDAGLVLANLRQADQDYFRTLAASALNAALALLQSSAPECRTAILAEREACAKIAERVAAHDPNVIGSTDERMTHRHAAMDVASAIRAIPAPPGSLASRPAASPELIAQIEANIEALRSSTGKEKSE